MTLKGVITLLLFSAVCRANLFAQPYRKLSLGMSLGYRYDNSSIYLEYAFCSKFDIAAEGVLNKYVGLGYGLGAYYYSYLFHEKAWSILTACVFSRVRGSDFSIEWTNKNGINQNTFFDVSGASYLIPTIGVRCDLAGETEDTKNKRKGVLSLFLRLGYRLALDGASRVTLVSGPPDMGDQKNIQRDVKMGIGFSIGFSLYIGKKEKA
jgi:hypothetical protein